MEAAWLSFSARTSSDVIIVSPVVMRSKSGGVKVFDMDRLLDWEGSRMIGEMPRF